MSGNRLSFEGPVYVAPVRRGISLTDEPGKPGIEEWIEGLIGQHKQVGGAGPAEARLRITVELLDDDSPA